MADAATWAQQLRRDTRLEGHFGSHLDADHAFRGEVAPFRGRWCKLRSQAHPWCDEVKIAGGLMSPVCKVK